MNDKQNTATGSNIDAAKRDAFDHIRQLGRAEGTGKMARPHMAEFVVARARDGVLDVGDAEEAWRMLVAGAVETHEFGPPDEATLKQRASDVKHFIVLGGQKMIDGIALLDHCKQRITLLRTSGAITGARIWELYLAFARKQNASPERGLSDVEIDRIISDKAAAQKAEADVLAQGMTLLEKANAVSEDDTIIDAIDLVKARIDALGGTTKQKRAATLKARKEAKAREKAAKKKR